MATKHLSLRRLFRDYCAIVANSQPGTCPICNAPAALSEHGAICSRGHLSDDQGTLPIGRQVDLALAIVPAVWREAGQATPEQAELAAAREDNAMLLSVLREIDFDYDKLSPRNQRLLNRISEAEHPGRALMGEWTKRMSDLARERDEAVAFEEDYKARLETAHTALEQLVNEIPTPNLDDPDLDAAVVFAQKVIAKK